MSEISFDDSKVWPKTYFFKFIHGAEVPKDNLLFKIYLNFTVINIMYKKSEYTCKYTEWNGSICVVDMVTPGFYHHHC